MGRKGTEKEAGRRNEKEEGRKERSTETRKLVGRKGREEEWGVWRSGG